MAEQKEHKVKVYDMGDRTVDKMLEVLESMKNDKQSVSKKGDK